MADQAQRSDGNVFGFRRLKWGDPPERLRIDSTLVRRIGAPTKPLRALPNDDEVEDGDSIAARPSVEMFQAPSVADLDKRRMRERFVDTASWGAAIVSVAALAAALIWIGWGQ